MILLLLLLLIPAVNAQCPLCPTVGHPHGEVIPGSMEDAQLLTGPLPPGSVCTPGERKGNQCCNSRLYEVMQSTLWWIVTRTDYADQEGKKLALGGRLMQKLIQRRFGKSFEVFLTKKDFSQLGNYFGNLTCKFEQDGMQVLAYASPVQYDVKNDAAEEALSNVDSRDPLAIPGNDTRLRNIVDLATHYFNQ